MPACVHARTSCTLPHACMVTMAWLCAGTVRTPPPCTNACSACAHACATVHQRMLSMCTRPVRAPMHIKHAHAPTVHHRMLNICACHHCAPMHAQHVRTPPLCTNACPACAPACATVCGFALDHLLPNCWVLVAEWLCPHQGLPPALRHCATATTAPLQPLQPLRHCATCVLCCGLTAHARTERMHGRVERSMCR